MKNTELDKLIREAIEEAVRCGTPANRRWWLSAFGVQLVVKVIPKKTQDVVRTRG